MSRKEAIIAATLPVLPILIPLGVHFVLLSFVFLSISWLPETYYFSHLVLLLLGIWACHDRETVIPVIAVVVVIIFNILLDVIQLGLFFPGAEQLYVNSPNVPLTVQQTWQFSATCTIFNLLFKPVSAVLCCFAVYVRSGGRLPGFLGSGGTGGGGDSYDTIHGGEE